MDKGWFLHKVYYPLWWAKVNCPRGKHVELCPFTGAPYNFCAACFAQINDRSYHAYQVVDKLGELDEKIYAVNLHHAKSFFRDSHHLDNLMFMDLGPVPGMTKDQWYEKMKPLADQSGYVMSQRG